MIRKTTRQEETTTETAYAIPSVSRDHSDPLTLLKWWRGHWGIENGQMRF
ncbi:hypothetical protein [Rubinisphaera sp.]|nr:hypothetical protein [Rubinisphaera sp.]|tara:strand:- start:28 stop:177 length:150 start_codon:yes stop_codon:yes gene_type:complete